MKLHHSVYSWYIPISNAFSSFSSAKDIDFYVYLLRASIISSRLNVWLETPWSLRENATLKSMKPYIFCTCSNSNIHAGILINNVIINKWKRLQKSEIFIFSIPFILFGHHMETTETIDNKTVCIFIEISLHLSFLIIPISSCFIFTGEQGFFIPLYLFFLDLLWYITAGSLCTGSHAADICVRAEADGMAFTTTCWFSPHPK